MKNCTFRSDRIPTARQLFYSCVLDAPEQDAREKKFFSSIKLKNGTYKTTESRRLDNLNDLILQFLPRANLLQVMDVAVSSGISTLEWMESLERAGILFEMTAGDYCLNAFLVCIGTKLAVLVDEDGYPLQFEIFGRAVPNPPGRRNVARYWAPLLLMKAALRCCFVEARNAIKQSRLEYKTRLNIHCSPLTLVSPRLKSRSNLTLVQDDILRNDRFKRRFQVIRVANILNKAYFNDHTLRAMLLNLRARILPEGLLAICRTEADGSNHGTIFVLSREGRLEAIARLGAGSEVEEIVINLPS